MKLLLALVRRLVELAATLFVVFAISFALMQLVPGGPFDSERNLPDAVKRNIEERYGLNRPWPEQFVNQLANTLRGDLGPSFKLADFNVNQILGEGLPISAALGIFALTIALFTGTIAGVVSAVRRNTWLDYSFMSAATFGIAVPSFTLATVAILLFVFWLQIFPAGGWGSLRQLILPACCLAAPYAAYIARLTRGGMLEVLHQDYIRTAYAKGLGEKRVILRHALRGALLPVVSFLGPATADIMAGSLVLERIFNLPGMGSHFVEAALQRDYCLAMGAVLIYTLLLNVMNTLVDLSYTFLDPRVKVE